MSGDIIASDPVHKVAHTPSDDNLAEPKGPDPLLKDDGKGAFGVADTSTRPGDRPHEGGDPRGDGDAQYGASPIREARYQEDHDVRDGKPHHRGVQPGKRNDPPDQL